MSIQAKYDDALERCDAATRLTKDLADTISQLLVTIDRLDIPLSDDLCDDVWRGKDHVTAVAKSLKSIRGALDSLRAIHGNMEKLAKGDSP